MFHNFFFLKRLSKDLNIRLAGTRLLECFSQNKDELIAGFGSEKDQLYIRANLDPQISLLSFTADFKRARKNTVDLFPEITGAKVADIRPFRYERSLIIHFENSFGLIFKMHASRSNILLVKDQKVQELFRHQLPGDHQLDVTRLDQKPDLSQDRFIELDGNPAKFLPALGKEVRAYLADQEYEKRSLEDRWIILQHAMNQLESNPVFIYNAEKPELSLLTLNHEKLLETDDAVEAANRLYELYTRDYYLNTEKHKAIRSLEEKIQKTENYISKTTQKLNVVKYRRSYEELANLIMANLHQIAPGKSEVTLFDFYTEKEISLKLKPELTPQKNAENLYRKSKNQKIEIENLESNIRNRQAKLTELLEEVDRVRETEDFKSLRKTSHEQPRKTGDVPLPYHQLVFQGFTILIGKNARHNDYLTQKIATKNDLWLHAKDVTGSHVIIRHQAGKNFPKDVMERAGQLAAWFSKRKTDTLCPVIYTPKKFVRKRKGDPPGAVIVEREEVMMIEPRGI